jgi:hypothetical protein
LIVVVAHLKQLLAGYTIGSQCGTVEKAEALRCFSREIRTLMIDAKLGIFLMGLLYWKVGGGRS